MATWHATGRYGIAAAPGGLALVHELLNTSAAGKPRLDDLLSDVALAQPWAEQAMRSWSSRAEPVVIDDTGLGHLRDLRTDLRASIDGTETPVRRSVALAAELLPGGTVSFVPQGRGWQRVTAAVLLEMAAAQHTDRWRRLKICRNPRCPVAFFDTSRNTSGAWHDVKVCGNAVNLRASRARRKGQPADG